MADQLRTTEGELYDSAFPPQDLAYYLGELLRAPVRGMPTEEDYRREQGELGLPTEAQTSRQVGQVPIDYVAQFLGPLLALITSQQYARQPSGRPAPTWGKRESYTQANSPLEQLRSWQKTKPWENQPPIGESAWTYRNPPQIGGPTGRGMTQPDILAAIEKEKFQGMLKQIRDLEAREAAAPRLPRPSPGAQPGQQIDDDQLDWMIKQMWKQGGADPGGPFKPPPLPGD